MACGALCAVEAALAPGLRRRRPHRRWRSRSEIGDVCCDRGRRLDPRELGAAARADGNPVRPAGAEAPARRSRAGADDAAAVHLGATSQDILDTALMLVARARVGVIASAAAELRPTRAPRSPRDAPRHRDGRAARCCSRPSRPRSARSPRAGARASTARRQRLAAVRTAPSSSAARPARSPGWHPHGPAVPAGARRASSASPTPAASWHTDRTPDRRPRRRPRRRVRRGRARSRPTSCCSRRPRSARCARRVGGRLVGDGAQAQPDRGGHRSGGGRAGAGPGGDRCSPRCPPSCSAARALACGVARR